MNLKHIIGILKRKYLLRVQKKCDTIQCGDDYDGYNFSINNLCDTSIVYSFGIGEDLTFSERIIRDFNCNVYAFDPTPKAIRYVHNHELFTDNRFYFHPFGLADYDGITQFHLPTNDNYVSGSMEKWDGVKDESIEVEVKKLQSIMNDLGHEKIDLLKMDIEGTEFSVFEDIIKSNINVDQICVEIHDRFFDDGFKRLKKMKKNMNKAGFYLIGRHNNDLTFLKME